MLILNFPEYIYIADIVKAAEKYSESQKKYGEAEAEAEAEQQMDGDGSKHVDPV